MKITAFYSDPHFGHQNIIKYCSRPFKDPEEMTIELVKRYNERISRDDLVVWVGDCSMGSKDVAHQRLKGILPHMNGEKILVRGNHDHNNPEIYLNSGFSVVTNELHLTLGNTPCIVNHFPMIPHPQFEKPDRFISRRPVFTSEDQVLIHGHTHSSLQVSALDRAINVSVEAHNYAPIMTYEVERLIKKIKVSHVI